MTCDSSVACGMWHVACADIEDMMSHGVVPICSHCLAGLRSIQCLSVLIARIAHP